jgi:hypothetical protein
VKLVVLLALAWLPLAVAQNEPGPNADLPAPPSSGTSYSPLPVSNGDVADKFLALVGPAVPSQLTEKQRFLDYLLNTAGPVPLIGEAAFSAIDQWRDSPPEWGQGWGAFGKRYASNLAYNGVRQTISYGTSILFHEDNRYFASTAQGFLPRTGHALISTFTARHPDGRQSFSFSSVAGVVGASAISSIWGPPSFKGVGNIAEIAGISFAATAGLNVVREFLPDVLHKRRPVN